MFTDEFGISSTDRNELLLADVMEPSSTLRAMLAAHSRHPTWVYGRIEGRRSQVEGIGLGDHLLVDLLARSNADDRCRNPDRSLYQIRDPIGRDCGT